MPRSHKGKGRSRTKRQNVQERSQSLDVAHTTAKEEPTSSIGQGDPPSSPDSCIYQGTQANVASVSDHLSVFSTSAVYAEASGPNAVSVSDDLSMLPIGVVGGETSRINAEASIISSLQRSRTFTIGSTTHSARRDPLNRKASVLMAFMLEKFRVKEHFTEKDMLKVINKKYKAHFPEIIRRISVHLELVFGLELKEVDPNSQSYTLVGILGLSTEGNLRGSSGLPKTGLLMTLLAVIFMNGNISSEEDIWEFLKVVGIFPGRNHPIFGEPREFITKDLVKENYLEYHRVCGIDPPKYVFLWGSRAHAETTKMNVLKVLAKINDGIPSSFPCLYEEALIDEANRAARRVTAVPGNASDSPHLGYITHNLSYV
ncbi:similar to Smage-1 protein (predicted) [Rattus norvegicus]|uniref:Similar to Smage-1 protein (Predicted) n=1 Tax=Rattus norvegicus TaxID=10116 RepID=A6IPZ2_RAT|nr:melanoma-associated antigen B4 [Rattus norvegicus]EDL96021.1 similar to Smage-1 protein (predicted) [Rattus norvegicus]